MDEARGRRHGGVEVHERGEHLVLDVDQVEGLGRDVRIDRRDGGDRVATPQRAVTSNRDGRRDGDVGARLPRRDHGARRDRRKIGRRHDAEHAFQGAGPGGVDPDDAGVRVRAALDAAGEQARPCEIGWIRRLAGDALAGIDARQALGDDGVAGCLRHGLASLTVAAASLIASTIFP